MLLNDYGFNKYLTSNFVQISKIYGNNNMLDCIQFPNLSISSEQDISEIEIKFEI